MGLKVAVDIIRQSKMLIKKKQFILAENLLIEAAKYFPDEVTVQYLLGLVCFRQDRHDDGVIAF